MLAILFSILAFAMTSPSAAQSGPGLIEAAQKGDLATVERLLARGVDIDARDGRGRTALLAATHGNHVAVARALIAAGAGVNAKDSIEDSPYLYAGAEGRSQIHKLTLAAGAATAIDKDHVNKLGWTALLEAVILGDGGPTHTEIVRLLVEAGANVNLADREGVTPLQHARRRGFREMVRILEARGGN